MMRLSTLVWLSLVGAMIGGLFHLKYEVIGLEKRLVAAKRVTRVNQEAIGILHAEWAYLSRPGRLDHLLRKRVDLMPLTRHQVTTFDRLERKLAMEITQTGPEKTKVKVRSVAHSPPSRRRRAER